MEIPYFIRHKDFTTIESTDCVYLDDINSDVIKRVSVLNFAAGLEPYLKKKTGSFYDTTTQTVISDEIAAIKLNTTDTDSTNGISVVNNGGGNPTRITVPKIGIYDIQFSAQLERLTGGVSRQIIIWLRKNGTDVPNSATHITMQANDNYIVASWNFFIKLNANDYCELMWTQNDAIELKYEPANITIPYPATPSVILTINEI